MAASGPWWRGAVIYQVYLRSFADSNGDGLGDLPGVRSRLPYLHDLGIDAVWLNPFYPSPQVDAGYDVTDYRDVDARFGTLADFDQLVESAHGFGLRVIIDLVPNHTSSEHPWFRAALRSRPGSAERARYVFRDGRGPTGAEPPNDWVSVFGGPAWTRVTGADGRPEQWYLHLFAAEQPDLDWTNPEVRAEFESILRFWLDRGVDGFRIDVAHGLAKDPALPDLAARFASAGPAYTGHPHWDQDAVHEVYRSWRRVSDAYPGDPTFVAEAWVHTPEQLARYVRPDELHTAFNFNFLLAPWDARALHTAIEDSMEALAAVGAPATWVLSNHDVVRHVTRYGGGAVGTRRARAAALLLLALPGSAYVYQGDELGLPEVVDLPDAVRQDPTFFRTGGSERGRDGSRVPLPWSGTRAPFGFGPAGSTPWLPQPPAWAELSVERQQADPTSMLRLYQAALRLRHELPSFRGQEFAWKDVGGRALAFRRGRDVWCVVNVGNRPLDPRRLGFAHARVLLASQPLAGSGQIPGDTAAWYTTD